MTLAKDPTIDDLGTFSSIKMMDVKKYLVCDFFISLGLFYPSSLQLVVFFVAIKTTALHEAINEKEVLLTHLHGQPLFSLL